ncbi:hypothetical protein P3X46_018820 [Hevea brasiliensis]|uniref:Cysteine-rich transmembrane CYSTM domain-containing protein n=1 Tax=Hevea brasiliensis TaxID=3981 RepID=A0ABQ9LRV1_HEVBR|nr:hypothetical protein P3X46_018820 [Hevea brasiliensis]
MEPPAAQAIERNYQAGEDEQDKVINECCSCCYDCTENCFDYLCCYNLC